MNEQESDVECMQLGNIEPFRLISTGESVCLRTAQRISKSDIAPLQLLWECTSYVLGGLETKQSGTCWM